MKINLQRCYNPKYINNTNTSMISKRRLSKNAKLSRRSLPRETNSRYSSLVSAKWVEALHF